MRAKATTQSISISRCDSPSTSPTPSQPLLRATPRGYLFFPFSQGHSSHFIVFHFKCVHLIMRLVSAPKREKKRMKSKKNGEKRRKSQQPQLLAKNIYIHFFFGLFFWLPRTLPKANSCPAGNEGWLLSCSLSLVSFGRSFWGNATVLLSVLHVALESRRQLVTSRMWRRGGSHCHSNMRHARRPTRFSLGSNWIFFFGDFTNCLRAVE